MALSSCVTTAGSRTTRQITRTRIAWVVQVSGNDGLTWVDLENTTVSDRSWRLMEFDLSDYIPLSDQVRVRFIAQDVLGESIVEAAVDDFAILATGFLGADAPEAAVPARFALDQNRPNPFNPRTTVRFSLAAGGAARLTVFDVSGRAVRSSRRWRPAGR